MFTKEAQDNLAKYLLGLNCDKQQLMMDLRNMNRRVDITYAGYVFRGMYFNHVIEKSEIHNQMVCSWSTDIEVAEQFGAYLGYALADLGAVLDPEIFVIGGGVSKAGEILFTYVKKYYEERTFFTCKDVKFALAKLGNDAGIYGAAKLVIA